MKVRTSRENFCLQGAGWWLSEETLVSELEGYLSLRTIPQRSLSQYTSKESYLFCFVAEFGRSKNCQPRPRPKLLLPVLAAPHRRVLMRLFDDSHVIFCSLTARGITGISVNLASIVGVSSTRHLTILAEWLFPAVMFPYHLLPVVLFS